MIGLTGSLAGERGRPVELSELWTPDEARRTAVDGYLSLRTEMQEALSRIAAVAARTCQVPMAAVSFVGDDHVWFSGRVGLPSAEASADPGLCATAILHAGPYVLIDAQADPRAARHPMVQGEPWVRFYAAAPVVDHDHDHGRARGRRRGSDRRRLRDGYRAPARPTG